MTPHINAKLQDIAKIVLISGDPLRTKYIAKNFLKKAKKVSQVRNMLIYTGIYKNKRITIASSGMGCSSMGIYSYELYKFYDVDIIIRIGTCGAYSKDLKLMDLINVADAFSESKFGKYAANYEKNLIPAQGDIYSKLNDQANLLGLKCHNVTVHSSDVFYQYNDQYFKDLEAQYGIKAVEMESYALFINAKLLNKKAACLLTVSDSFHFKKNLSSKERETKMGQMITLALQTAAEY